MIEDRQERKAAVLEALSSGRPARYAELRRIARTHSLLQELIDDGFVERIGYGLYGLPGRESTWDAFAMLSTKAPEAVICLFSAAAYHGLTTQNPHEITAAFPYGTVAIPRSAELAVRGYRWRGASMDVGIEIVDIGATKVLITSPARTVVDLIRTKGKTGEDEAAMEALGTYVSRGGRPADLLKLASALNCAGTLRPYVEAAQGFRGPRT